MLDTCYYTCSVATEGICVSQTLPDVMIVILYIDGMAYTVNCEMKYWSIA